MAGRNGLCEDKKNFAVLRDKYLGDVSRHRLIFMCALHAYNIDVVVQPLVVN